VSSETTGFDQFGPNNPAVLNVTVTEALDGEIQLAVTDTDGTSVDSWNLTTETGSGEVATVRWNGTNRTGTPVDSDSYEVRLTAGDGLGNSNETIETVSVDTTPPESAIAAPGRVVVNSPVSLNASGSTDNREIEQFEWTFSDGSTENTSDPVVNHAFANTGTETIRLKTTDRAGNTNSTSTAIEVQEPPSVTVVGPEYESYVANDSVRVDYTLSNTSLDAAANLEYQVTNESTGTRVTEWTVGDFEATNETVSRSISTESLADGNYSVDFRIVDHEGTPLAYESATDNVSFAVKTTSPTVGLTVSPETRGSDLFGPNNPATLNISVEDYLSTDTQLWITDTEGRSVVEWNLTTETGSGELTTVSWDGTDATGTPVDSGSYEVGVTATDDIGNRNETSRIISVDTKPPVPTLTAPETVFTNTPLTLNASGSTDNNEIARFEWTFPDGSTETGQSVSHEFSDGGTKTVTLTATDRAGNTNSTSTEIAVEEIPAVSVRTPGNESYVANHTVPVEYTLSHTDSEDTAGLEYRLVSESTGVPITDWTESEYTETSGSVSRSLSVGPLADGEYSLDLRLVDQNGGPLAYESTTDSVLFTIDTGPPTVGLDVSPQTTGFDQFGPNNPAVLNVTVDSRFGGDTQLAIIDADETAVAEWNLSTDTGSGELATVSWDGTNSTGTPLDSGSYEARVTAIDSNGLTAEETESLSLDTTPPVPKITVPDTVVMGSAVTLDADRSTDNSGIEQFEWTFSDGTIATEKSVTHTFSTEGSERVTLTTTDRGGNTNTTSTDLDVQPAPSVTVTAPENGSYVTSEMVPIEYDLLHTNSETSALEYRLSNATTGQTVIDWTQGTYEKTDETAGQSTTVGPVADGNYSVDLRLVDQDGTPLSYAASTDSVSFAVKSTPPSVDLDVRSETAAFDHIGPNNPAVLNVTVGDPLDTETQLWITDSEGQSIAEWNLTTETGSSELTTVDWNGTDGSGTPLDSGSYEVGVTATDRLGNTNTTNETTDTVTVDTDTPSVEIQSVDGATQHNGLLFVNDSSTVTIRVAADDGRTTPGPLDDLILQAELTDTNDRFTPTIQQDADAETRWTATIQATDFPAPGPYQFTASGVDAANNTGFDSTTIEYDSTAPQLSAVITDVDTETEQAEIRARSTEPLAESPSVTATDPDGRTQSVALTESAGRWTGSFEVNTSGQYTLTARGVDPAGNQGVDNATTTVDSSVSTEDRTTTVYSDSGLFIRFNTTEEVTNRTVSMTETTISPEALDREQFGVQFLEGELDDVLNARLENATIGIPADAEALPDGVGIDDPQVEISYYNDGWESQPTEVRTIEDQSEGIDGTYWTTTVDSFSTYGVTVTDSEPPALLNVTATPSGDSESVTITATYEDELSAVNASAVELSINGTDQTAHESTSITSTSATREGYPIGNGTYRVTVSLEDEAGNTERYEQIVSVDSETNESDDEPESVVGGGGGMGGGPTPATTELHSSSLSVSPSRPETGQAVTVSIELENTGDKIAHETISLQADGQTVVSEDVRLSSGATHEARLTHRFAAPGEYDLTVDSPSLGSLSAGTVTVTGDPIADSEDDSEQTGDESTVNETPGFGLVGAIVAVLGLGVLLGRRE